MKLVISMRYVVEYTFVVGLFILLFVVNVIAAINHSNRRHEAFFWEGGCCCNNTNDRHAFDTINMKANTNKVIAKCFRFTILLIFNKPLIYVDRIIL